MKNRRKIKDITFEIYGRILMIVSRISLSYTDDLMSLNIRMILNALNTVAKDEKLASSLSILRRIDKSVVNTIMESNMFHE